LYKGRLHHVTIEAGGVKLEPGEQLIDVPPLWVMDFNLRRTAYDAAQTENLDFVGFYGDQVTLSPGSASGTYTSPVHDWTEPVVLREISVAVDLHGGQVTAIVETSNDAFQTAPAQLPISLRDGVQTYPLDPLNDPASTVRVRFTLERSPRDEAAPVLDGFRMVGAM
jgi:hypothetical protein